VKGGAALRRARGPAVVAVAYLVLRMVFDGATERGGLISPDGSVSAGVAVLGGVVIVLRLVVLFGLPAWGAYRLAGALFEALRGQWTLLQQRKPR
jgi:hypothetical protein